MEIKDKHGRLLHKIEDKLRDFSDLDLPEAVFAEMLLQGAHFSGSNLTGADFNGADLYWSDFSLANLTLANFERAQLQGADFKQANLTKANLRDANLGRDNVGGATQLQGADLTGAELRGAKLDGAEYDEHTIFPLGFRAEKKNLILKSPKSWRPAFSSHLINALAGEVRTSQCGSSDGEDGSIISSVWLFSSLIRRSHDPDFRTASSDFPLVVYWTPVCRPSLNQHPAGIHLNSPSRHPAFISGRLSFAVRNCAWPKHPLPNWN